MKALSTDYDAAFLPDAQSGLGLGLAIVRHIVELHGGTVRADSNGRDTGTRFVMRLPSERSSLRTRDSRRPTTTAAATTATDVPRPDGLRILIVDDNRESCDVMLETLGGYGASVCAAMSANAAVDALSEFTPDFVLTDIAMPGGDGCAVLSEVRALDMTRGRRVPVVAVTAYAHSEDRERAIAGGFDDYLAKPLDPATLALTVSSAQDVIGNRSRDRSINGSSRSFKTAKENRLVCTCVAARASRTSPPSDRAWESFERLACPGSSPEAATHESSS